MVYKATWAPRALEDLREIVSYIRLNNPAAAFNFGQKIIKKAETLADSPERGRMISKLQDPKTREVFLGSYHIAYRINSEQAVVEIARVWHGARDLENIVI